MREDIGDRQFAALNTLEEIAHVAAGFLALVELDDILVEPFLQGWVLVDLYDRLAGDTPAVDEDAALLALDQDAAAAAFQHDRTAIRERHRAMEIGGHVIVILPRVEFADSFDLHRAGVFQAQSPHGDIRVVHAPIGHLAAGVFQPVTKKVVRPLLDVGHLGRLPEPHVPVQVRRRILLFERTARLHAAD